MVLCCIHALCAWHAPLAQAAQKDASILVLHAAEVEQGQVAAVLKGMHWILDSQRHARLETYSLAGLRSGGAEYGRLLSELLAVRYAENQPDVVVTVDDASLAFMVQHGARIFPRLPVLFASFIEPSLPGQIGFGGEVSPPDFSAALAFMKHLQPSLVTVHAIADATPQSAEFLTQLEKAASRVGLRIEPLVLWTQAELTDRLRGLPAGNAALVLGMTEDVTGALLGEDQQQKALSAAAVPVYSLWEWHVGRGAIGGVVIDTLALGADMARLALRYTEGAKPRSSVEIRSRLFTLVDEGIVRRYRIPLERIPGDTDIRNRKRTLREQEPGLFYGATASLGILLVVTGALTFNVLQRRRAMRKVLQAEQRYRSLFENAVEGIFRGVVSGGFLAVNPAMATMLGHGRPEEFMRDVPDLGALFATPQEYEAVLQMLEQQAVVQGVECRLARRDGTVVMASLSARCERNRFGVLGVIEGRIVDITAEKAALAALEEQRERLRLALEAANDGLWDWNVTTGSIYFSPRYFSMLGYAAASTTGGLETWLDLLHPDDAATVTATAQRVMESPREGDQYDATFRMRGADGDYRWILSRTLVARRGEDGRALRAVGVHTDITDLRRTQEALANLNRELEERVLGRTRELREANQALELSLDAVNRMQDELVQAEKMASLGGLVAGVAHEINTPVGIGVTAVSWLSEKTDELTSALAAGTMRKSDLEKFLATAAETCATILSNLRRAADLVQSFKQVAVDQTAGDIRAFNLRQFIDEVLMSLKPRYKRTTHRVEVDVHDDIMLTTYPGDLMQILTNFVTNSLMHGFEDKENGVMRIAAHAEDGKLVLIYADDGKGMDAEHASRVFEPFFTTKRGQGGTGLGMHIVFNLVTQRLKGTITCESAPGTGATFTLRLPLDIRPGGTNER